MKNVKHYIALFSLILLAILPGLAHAAFDFSWVNPSNDKSIYYLGEIFGNVGTVLQGTTNPLVGGLFQVFNIAILTLGTLVISYSVVMSTIHTAHEGKAMGQKWPAIWIPLRALVGIGALLPTSTGYSLIQIVLMQIILLGIAAGNQVWQRIIASMESGTGAFGVVTIGNPGDLDNLSMSLLNSMVCAQVMNTNPSCQSALNNNSVTTYTAGDSMYVGVNGSPQFGSLCGGLETNVATPPQVYDYNSWLGANLSAFLAAAATLGNAASQINTYPTSLGWTSTNVIQTASNALQGIGSAPLQQTISSNQFSQSAISNGWLVAGSYYFELVSQNTNINFPAPTVIPIDTSQVGLICSQAYAQIAQRTTAYLAATQTIAPGASNNQLVLQKPQTNSISAQVYSAVGAPITQLTFDIMNQVHSSQSDPLSSMHAAGITIMSTTEGIWLGMILLVFGVQVLACLMAGINSACLAINALLSIAMPALTFLLAFLWGAGVTLGIYLPLVPYIVFSFTALGWMLLVVEAMAAAPVIALGLANPEGKSIGEAAPSVLIITNVFLRPSLMLIGFIAASKMVRVAMAMINYGFQSTVEASIGMLGLFGCVALLCIYSALIMSVLHECFSLIHVLPEQIIRWIGGHAEKSSMKEHLQEIQGAGDKGAKMGAEMMKGSGAKTMEASKSIGGGKKPENKSQASDEGGGG